MRTSWITRECAKRNVANNRRCHVRTSASRGVRCRLRPRMCGTHTDCLFPNTLRIVQHQVKLGALRTPVDSAKTAARFVRSINVWLGLLPAAGFHSRLPVWRPLGKFWSFFCIQLTTKAASLVFASSGAVETRCFLEHRAHNLATRLLRFISRLMHVTG